MIFEKHSHILIVYHLLDRTEVVSDCLQISLSGSNTVLEPLIPRSVQLLRVMVS